MGKPVVFREGVSTVSPKDVRVEIASFMSETTIERSTYMASKLNQKEKAKLRSVLCINKKTRTNKKG